MPSTKKSSKRTTIAEPPEGPQPGWKPGHGSWHKTRQTKASAGIVLGSPGQFLTLSREGRQQKENLFVMPVDIKLFGSWRASEDYWLRKDLEMLEYLQDWPISNWLVDPTEARNAYIYMQDRFKLRDSGASVYSGDMPLCSTYGPSREESGLARFELVEDDQLIEVASKPAAHKKLALTEPGPKDTSLRSETPRAVTKTQISKRALRQSTKAANGIVQESPRVLSKPVARGAEFDVADVKVKRGTGKARGSDASDDAREMSKGRYGPGKTPTSIPTQTPPPYESDGVQIAAGGDFPWQATCSASDPEEWDDSIYDPARLRHLEQVHARNRRIVNKYMQNVKDGAHSRRSAAATEASRPDDQEEVPPPPDDPVAERPSSKRGKIRKPRASDARDVFQGRLVFADKTAEDNFNKLGFEAVEDAIESGMSNPHNTLLQEIEVAHDPGDSIIADLELPRISLMDISRTRLQLRHIKILTDRAAECIIDFCPDMLCGFTVLQIASETRYSNTNIQTRLGSNGCMLSDSTITKRVSAALNRDYDKIGSKAAAERTPGYKKVNRQTYDKYKMWRGNRREHGGVMPTTFDLDHEAALFREQLDKSISASSPTEVIAAKQPRRRRSTKMLGGEDYEVPDHVSSTFGSAEQPKMDYSGSDDTGRPKRIKRLDSKVKDEQRFIAEQVIASMEPMVEKQTKTSRLTTAGQDQIGVKVESKGTGGGEEESVPPIKATRSTKSATTPGEEVTSEVPTHSSRDLLLSEGALENAMDIDAVGRAAADELENETGEAKDPFLIPNSDYDTQLITTVRESRSRSRIHRERSSRGEMRDRSIRSAFTSINPPASAQPASSPTSAVQRGRKRPRENSVPSAPTPLPSSVSMPALPPSTTLARETPQARPGKRQTTLSWFGSSPERGSGETAAHQADPKEKKMPWDKPRAQKKQRLSTPRSARASPQPDKAATAAIDTTISSVLPAQKDGDTTKYGTGDGQGVAKAVVETPGLTEESQCPSQ